MNGSTRATYWGTSSKWFTGRLISEMRNTNINSVNHWKALSTIAVPVVKGESREKIYELKIINLVI
ncbi:YrpD family protein [Bacillus pseudomycoides]|uniref:YrpD family protein n=1 Tax=Bacillus pseudomycoides TaxID=64104 RepID=UPI0011559325